jgi:hypothetical protein
MLRLYGKNRIMPDTAFPAPAGAQEDVGDPRTQCVIVSVNRAPAPSAREFSFDARPRRIEANRRGKAANRRPAGAA